MFQGDSKEVSVDEKRGERVEVVVDIYESADTVRAHDSVTKDMDTEKISQSQQIGGHTARFRRSILAPVCLGLLCVLLLAAIIVLWVKFTAERDQLETSYNNLTVERDQLQTSYDTLTVKRHLESEQFKISSKSLTIERDQLQTSIKNLNVERDLLQTKNINLTTHQNQLQTSYNNLTKELNELLTSYNNLTVEKEQLLRERNVFQRGVSVLGWSYFNFSIYYITTVKKYWSESRNYCTQREADLVIINSREEQNFLSKTFPRTEAWIGLTDQDKEGTWKWVDSKPLTTSYWWKEEPNDYGGKEDCVITGYKSANDSLLTWNDYPCNFPEFGICEIVLN